MYLLLLRVCSQTGGYAVNAFNDPLLALDHFRRHSHDYRIEFLTRYDLPHLGLNNIITSSNNSNNIISENVNTTPTSSVSSSNSTSTTGITTNGTSNSNYTPSLGIPLHPVSDIEIAEITMIAENAHRYLQIAFAEDMYLYCQANGISFPELREALNTKWNVEILEPREGVGGHCLPKDTKMFIQSTRSISTRSKILKAAIEVDEEYKLYRLSLRTDVPKIVPFINTNKKQYLETHW